MLRFTQRYSGPLKVQRTKARVQGWGLMQSQTWPAGRQKCAKSTWHQLLQDRRAERRDEVAAGGLRKEATVGRHGTTGAVTRLVG